MNPFIIPEVVNAAEDFNGRHFPLKRADDLQSAFAMMFSAHLGCLNSGDVFESEVLMVTGASGAGKTREIHRLLAKFEQSGSKLPSGQPARVLTCVLDRKGGWKDLGKKTLHAMNFKLSPHARLTQTEIWYLVSTQARLQGIIAIHYDETQHILAGKTEGALEEVLDSFKDILKSKSWPLMLVLSGVPELAYYIPQFQQLARKVSHLTFDDIDFSSGESDDSPDDRAARDADASIGCYPDDPAAISEIVQNYAMQAGLDMEEDLYSHDFIHRLATSGAFRWGLVFEITTKAIMIALAEDSPNLKRYHFIEMWVSKTGMNRAATPFTHEGYTTMYRRDAPFRASIST